jgi:hypothetical protein
MRISFCLIAYNEAVTLAANLRSLYTTAHEIIICEGSIALLRKQLGLATRSDDGTCELLEAFPDPQRKLRIIQREWQDKNEMSAAYAQVATGDLIWHVDADEFYDDAALAGVPREFERDPALLTLDVPMYVFWKSPQWVLATADGDDRWFRYARVLRRTPGMSVRHIPVRRVIEGRVDESGRRGPLDDRIVAWHYAWNDDARVRTKMELYARRDSSTTRADWLQEVWDRWTHDSPPSDWPDGVHPSTQWRLWPRRYDGRHPRSVTGDPDLLDRLDLLTAVGGRA